MVSIGRSLQTWLPAFWVQAILALAMPAGDLNAQVIPYDPSSIRDAAQDGNGQAWALAGL